MDRPSQQKYRVPPNAIVTQTRSSHELIESLFLINHQNHFYLVTPLGVVFQITLCEISLFGFEAALNPFD